MVNRKKRSTNINLKLGSILLRMGKINKRQLSIALVASEETSKFLGETLIDLECITKDELDRALEIQKRMVQGRSASAAMLEIVEERTRAGEWNQLIFLKKG